MADRMMFVTWRDVVRGREERAVEVFNETVGLYGRMQQDGRIERFEVVLLNPNGELGGYFDVRGSAQQLAAVREDEEWQRNILDASLIVDDIRVLDGVCDEEIARQMGMYQDAIAKVPQAT